VTVRTVWELFDENAPKPQVMAVKRATALTAATAHREVDGRLKIDENGPLAWFRRSRSDI
jgi:hypothetical protein